MDSGATKTVCGTSVWNHLVEYMVMRDIMENVVTKHEPKDFRFGDGVVIRSTMVATIPVCVAQQWRSLNIHVLPGNTPLLLARPVGEVERGGQLWAAVNSS